MPSPAWKTLATGRPNSVDISPMRVSTRGSARRGMVPSMQSMSGAMRPAAAKAALRPSQMRSRSASDVLASQVSAPFVMRDGVDLLRRGVDFDFHAVEFGDEDGGGFARIAGRAIGFDRVDGEAVHDFHRGGHDAGGDDVGDAGAGLLRSRGRR